MKLGLKHLFKHNRHLRRRHLSFFTRRCFKLVPPPLFDSIPDALAVAFCNSRHNSGKLDFGNGSRLTITVRSPNSRCLGALAPIPITVCFPSQSPLGWSIWICPTAALNWSRLSVTMRERNFALASECPRGWGDSNERRDEKHPKTPLSTPSFAWQDGEWIRRLNWSTCERRDENSPNRRSPPQASP